MVVFMYLKIFIYTSYLRRSFVSLIKLTLQKVSGLRSLGVKGSIKELLCPNWSEAALGSVQRCCDSGPGYI